MGHTLSVVLQPLCVKKVLVTFIFFCDLFSSVTHVTHCSGK